MTFYFPRPITLLTWDVTERVFFAGSADGDIHQVNLFKQLKGMQRGVLEAVGGAGSTDAIRITEEDEEAMNAMEARTYGLGIRAHDLPQSEGATYNGYVDDRCTLRRMNRAYRDAGGVMSVDTMPEEIALCTMRNAYAPLRRFMNMVGHFIDGATVSFYPDEVESMAEVLRRASEELKASIQAGYLWDLSQARLLHRVGDAWYHGGTRLNLLLFSRIMRDAHVRHSQVSTTSKIEFGSP